MRLSKKSLLFGVDCKSLADATLLPPEPLEPADVSDYREGLILSLVYCTCASIKKAQKHYKAQYTTRGHIQSTTELEIGF